MARKLYRTYIDAHRAIDAAFRMAHMFHDSSQQIDTRMAVIREELNSKTPAGRWRYSEFERFSSAGYMSARYHDIWEHVEFCYRDASGTLFSTHKESTHRKTEEFYVAGRGSELPKLEAAYVWKGTDRNYTPWSHHSSEQHKAVKE